MHGFPYWEDGASPPTNWKFVHSLPSGKMQRHIKFLSPKLNNNFLL